ncbi:MAG: ABC transporter ATP-binding protein [candidate division WOR-3 bacterium]
MKAIEIEEIRFGYRDRVLFDRFSLTIEQGEFFGVIGPNGSGKSTLLRLIAGILKPQGGRIKLLGKDLNRLSRRQIARVCALVPQESFFAFEWTVEEVVMMGRNPFLGTFAQPKALDWERVEEVMAQTGVIGLRDKSINSISTGEKQRVIVARALAQEPEVILLDEATSHLDLFHQLAIIRILLQLKNQGKTVVFVSHDLNEAAKYCSKILLLAQGRMLACDKPEGVITPDLIKEAYGVEPVITIHPVSGQPQVFLPEV